jgi:PAS domain S-box-containing protein
MRRLDIRVRAVATVVIGYAAGVAVFVRGGLQGNAQVLLLALPAIALIMLGRRFGIVTAGLSILLIVLMRLISAFEGIPIGFPEHAAHGTDNVVPTIVFVTTLTGLMILQWRSTAMRESTISENVKLWQISEQLRAFSENIISQIDEGIVLTDADGMITFVNPSGARALGYTPAELRGRPLPTIFDEDQSQVAELTMMEGEDRGAARYETALTTRSSESLPVIWSARAFAEADRSERTLSVFTDITEMKQAEQALVASEEAARAVLNAATESMVLSDTSGHILDLNETAADRFGLQPEELLGVAVHAAMLQGRVPPEVLAARDKVLRDVAETGAPARFEDEYGDRVFDHNYYPIRGSDGRVARLALFSRDITAERRSEEQAMRAERLAAMGRVAASLAHEVNNPLQAIRNNLELLQAFDLSPRERQERLRVSLEAIDRLSAATQRALQLRTTSARDRQVVPLGDPVRRTLALMDGPLCEADISVTVDIPAEPVKVHVATDQLVQVLVNLVVNAIDAIGHHGSLEVAVRGEDEQAVVEVCNSGPPLTEEQSAQLFDPHFTTKEGHVGLGLSVSHDIIGLHGGTICADNLGAGLGVRFTIRLPRARAEED